MNNNEIIINGNAICELDISINDISGVFQFYTDISNVNYIDINTSNILYKCISNNWHNINFSNAIVTVNKYGPYSNNQMYNDIVRYIATQLLYSYKAVDFFTNESNLSNEIKNSENLLNNSIRNTFNNANNLDNNNHTSNNLSRQLFKTILVNDSDRLNQILLQQYNNNEYKFQNIPLIIGDIISFKLNFIFPNCSSLNLATNIPIPKNYIIKLYIK